MTSEEFFKRWEIICKKYKRNCRTCPFTSLVRRHELKDCEELFDSVSEVLDILEGEEHKNEE